MLAPDTESIDENFILDARVAPSVWVVVAAPWGGYGPRMRDETGIETAGI
ncbi:hypothetical protein [Rhodococcus marinonascens]|nr:hypothetical protein [Rhodococcus marinonascens]